MSSFFEVGQTFEVKTHFMILIIAGDCVVEKTDCKVFCPVGFRGSVVLLEY